MKKMKLMLLFVVLLILLIGVVNATELQDNSTSSTDNGATKVVKKTSTISQVDSTTQNDNIQTATKNTKKSVNEDTTIKTGKTAINNVISSDMNDNDIVAETNKNNPFKIERSSEGVKNSVNPASDEKHVLGDYDDQFKHSFIDLEKLINQTPEGGILNLEDNFNLALGGSPVKISKSITINGNGHILDNAKKNQTFYIAADGKTVVFHNISFYSRGVQPLWGNVYGGGAIFNNHSSTAIKMTNCRLFDITIASSFGGAIYTAGDLYVNQSLFEDNFADCGGGAIYCEGNLVVDNSTFTTNWCTLENSEGGAIWSKNACHIYNSYFQSNYLSSYVNSTYTNGGAIYCESDVYVNNTRFSGNHAKSYNGGAIYSKGNLYSSHSEYSANEAYVGGAIYCSGETHLSYDQFYGNYHEEKTTKWEFMFMGFDFLDKANEGGAVYSVGKCYVDSCIFKDNHACEHGGAIFAGNDLIITGQNNVFESNHATRGYYFNVTFLSWSFIDKDGGAIYCKGNLLINNTRFLNNAAYVDGGATYCEKATSVYNSIFENNQAAGIQLRTNYGGAIFTNRLTAVNNCSFFNNSADKDRDSSMNSYGGAIYINNNYEAAECNIEIISSTFNDNACNWDGGAIYIDKNIYHIENNPEPIPQQVITNLIVQNSTFSRNRAGVDGGAIYCPGKTTVSDSVFNNNYAIKYGSTQTCYGGAIRSKDSVNVNNCNFTGNTADYGGAIYSYTETNINFGNFQSNTAKEGGAIYTSTLSKVYNSSFKGSVASSGDGGAIYINNKCNSEFTLCTFASNKCSNTGGAIYMDSSASNLKLDNCTFNINNAKEGGAIYTGLLSTVTKSTFKSNTATSDNGGAIYVNNNCNPEFVSCTFDWNTCPNGLGGSIYMDSVYSYLRLYDSSFSNCSAKEGGAVYAHQLTQYLSGCNFTNNKATAGKGGAIYVKNNDPEHFKSITCELMYSNFNNNSCTDVGGAIFFDSMYASNKITSCSFSNNTAKQGGAIYTHKISYVIKSSFINNKATSGDGGAILIKNDDTSDYKIKGEIIDCHFDKNTCTNMGGGIYMGSFWSTLKVSYSTFTNNTAGQGGAIYANKVSGISDCAFLENKAKGLEKSDGGAVYINRNCKAETISCRYEGNTAENRGGAIYTDSLETDMRLKVSYCTFVHNHADQKNYKGSSHYYGPGHSIFNSGYYDFVKLCWFGLNNSNFKGQIVEYHRGRNDEDYNVSDYLKIAMKINDTNPYAGNPYKVTVYFVGTKGGLQLDVHKLYHSTGTFYGDGEYSNIKADVNDMTADVVLNAGANTLYAKLDDQVVSLSVNAITKDPSEVQILSCEGLKFPRSAKVKYSINHYSQNATYTITDSTGKVVKQAKLNSPSRDLYIDNLWPGTYTITIFNPETEKYLSSSANATFTSLKADMTFGLEVFDETYPGTVECIVYPGMDGEYECNLTVTGTSSIVYSEIVTVKNFDGDHFNIGVLYPGIYEATIYYSGSATYNPFSTSTRFKVNTDGTLFEIGIVPSEVNYGQTAEVIHILPDAATGDITYQLNNGTKLATLPVDQNLTLPKLDVGSYVIIAQYSGDMEYESANESAKFTVNQASNMAYVTASNVTYGKDTLIQVTADVDGTYQLDIKGTIHNVTVNNGVGNKTILLDAGTYYANITFNDKNYNTNSKNTTFTVNKAINNIIVTANNVTYGKDTLIQVTADVDGTYQLDISGELYNIIVSEGKANKTLTLNAGTYYANITFNDKNYNTNSKNTTFIVNKAPNNLDVKVNNVTYGKETVIEISANVDGEYIVNINDSIYEVTVKNGKANKTLNLDAGNYYAYVTFTDDNYNTVAKNMTFTVSKANITLIIMSFDEIYPEEVEVSVYASLDGKYKLRVANITTDITVKYHVASYVVGTLNPGVYEAVVSFDGDNNYNPSLNKTIITIYTGGVLFEIEVNPNNISYGQTANVTHTISEDALGTIEYFLSDGTFLGELPVNKNLTLPVLDVGDYVIIANYTGDFFHNATYETATLTVNPLPNHVTISVNNVVYGEDTLIQIIADVDGIYQLDVNGNVYDINIINGAGNKTLKLDAGKYYANVTFNNKNYNTNTTNVTFSVHKAEIDLVVVVFDEVYPEDVECIVYASADGEYNLTIAGHSTTVNVKDNIAYYNAGVLDAGTYEAVVSFDGDENHNNAFNTTTFHVYASGTSFELEVIPNEISYGQSAKVTHTISEGATGTIKYYLSNGTYLGGLPVNENLTLPVLDAGSYVIIGNYTGDNDFISAVDTTFITVNPISNNVIVSVSNVTYGEETLIQISADIDGTYQMDVNGEINEITVTDGKANKTLNLKAGNYYVNITFDNNNYKTHSQNATFTVYKADTIITTSQQTNYIGENITLTAKVTDKDGNNMNSGRVIFKLNGVTLKDKRGKTIYAKVENGTATITYIIPSNYQAKSYKLTAVYEGNDNYLGIRNDSQLNLKQRQIKLTLNTSKDVKIMQQLQLHVTVTDEIDNNKLVNGYIIFKIDGKTLKDENNKTIEVRIVNNTADYNYTIGHEFTAKEHTITAVLVNNTYSRSQADDTFKITTTQITINLDKITTNTKTAQLTGTIMDTKQNTITGTDKLLVKINGITIRNEDNTTQYYNITNGQIDITLNITKLKTGEHTVEVVTQESNIHLSTRNKTTLTITEEVQKKTTTNTKTEITKKQTENMIPSKEAVPSKKFDNHFETATNNYRFSNEAEIKNSQITRELTNLTYNKRKVEEDYTIKI